MTSPTSNIFNTIATGGASTANFINVLKTAPDPAFPHSVDPTPYDYNYQVQKRWINITTQQEFILANFTTTNGVTLANWVKLGSGSSSMETLTGNSGGVVGPDVANNINTLGDATSINIIGNPSTHTLTANVILPAQYDVLASNISSISGITPGAAGTILTSNGASAFPTFQTPPSLLTWIDVTGTTQTIAVNTGYLADNAGLVTFTLPATAPQFSLFIVQGYGAGGWKIDQNAGQQMILGTGSSTVGVGGSMASTNRYDTVEFIAAVGGASTVWVARSCIGNITIV